MNELEHGVAQEYCVAQSQGFIWSIKGEYDMQQVSLLLSHRLLHRQLRPFQTHISRFYHTRPKPPVTIFLGLSQVTVAAALRVITDSVRHSAVDYHQ